MNVIKIIPVLMLSFLLCGCSTNKMMAAKVVNEQVKCAVLPMDMLGCDVNATVSLSFIEIEYKLFGEQASENEELLLEQLVNNMGDSENKRMENIPDAYEQLCAYADYIMRLEYQSDIGKMGIYDRNGDGYLELYLEVEVKKLVKNEWISHAFEYTGNGIVETVWNPEFEELQKQYVEGKGATDRYMELISYPYWEEIVYKDEILWRLINSYQGGVY